MQRLSIEAQNQALNIWLKEVIRSMEYMEVKRNKMYISDASFYLVVSTMMSHSVKEGLDTSRITQMFVNSEKQVLKDLKMKDPEEDKKIEKLQEELFTLKLISESLKRQLDEVKEE